MNKNILLVEDDDNDIFFMELAMKRAATGATLLVVRNGEEAIRYLSGEGKFADHDIYPVPDVTLLDLRLPLIPGLDVLKWVRDQPGLKDLAVIILSSSNQKKDVEKARELGADSFLVKPANPKELVEIIKYIQRYWSDEDGPPDGCEEWNTVDLLSCSHDSMSSLGASYRIDIE